MCLLWITHFTCGHYSPTTCAHEAKCTARLGYGDKCPSTAHEERWVDHNCPHCQDDDDDEDGTPLPKTKRKRGSGVNTSASSNSHNNSNGEQQQQCDFTSKESQEQVGQGQQQQQYKQILKRSKKGEVGR